MGRLQPLVELNMNDVLTDVIRKVNTNFKLLHSNFFTERSTIEIDIGDAIDDIIVDFNNEILAERSARQTADTDINNRFDNYCPLDSDTHTIDPQYLPSYIDDVVECTVNPMAEPYSSTWLKDINTGDIIIPSTGKIYVVIFETDSTVYRWSGSQYTQISSMVDNYNQLSNKPSIENVTLTDNKDFDELGIFMTDQQGYSVPDEYTLTTQEINSLWENASPIGG